MESKRRQKEDLDNILDAALNELDSDDCDDTRAAVNPSVNEDCSTSYDDDCDGDINDEDPDGGTRFYADVDADGYGDPADSRWYCETLGIYNELDDDDCDDYHRPFFYHLDHVAMAGLRGLSHLLELVLV